MNILKKEVKFDKRVIIAFLLVNFLVLGLYYTYAIFVTKQLQENVAVLVTSDNSISINSLKQFVVSANSTKDVEVKLANNSLQEKYYYLLHEKVPTGVMVYETYNDSSSKGIIGVNEEKSVFVTITNDTLDDVTVSFYCQGSVNEIVNKEMGYGFINQYPSYDHSGANRPSLTDINAIPIYYEKTSDLTGVWRKADVNNNDSSGIWYDYDNGRWANIALVKEESRARYFNALVGTEILSSDILAYMVWIPSFRYYVINSNSNTIYEKSVNVVFESGSIKQGTVTCVDSLKNSDNSHVYSEKCSDIIYGKVYENLSTYSHPAFADQKLGFWVSKFQVSSNGSRVIPSVPATIDSFENAFLTSRKMELKGNIYGINNNGLEVMSDGSIKNDSNNLDSHLLSNMEWGAIAILSNSLYGKSGNSDYYDKDNYTFKRIYANLNNLGYTGCSTNYTKSTNNLKIDSIRECVSYNDHTNYTHVTNTVNYPVSSAGIGASTTGTVYGVYDMAGANYEMVSGIVMNDDGTSLVSYNEQYYDKYSYNDYIGVINDISNVNNLYRYKLGDGIREHYRIFSDNGMWQSGELAQSSNTGYIIRGGNYDSGRAASIYTSDIVDIATKNAYRMAISLTK